MAQSAVTSRTIAVEHIKIESEKKSEEVRRALGRRPDDHPSLSDLGL